MKNEGLTQYSIKKISTTSCQYIPWLVLSLAIFFVLLPDSSFAAGVNRLAGLKQEVKATFGKDSDVPYFILLAEGLVGAYTYMKTKSPAALIGVPVLMIFTAWAI